MITFRKITEFPRGTLVLLLRKGYSFEPQFERDWLEQWKEFDDFFTIIQRLQTSVVS
ncbi:MAG: hypothetical protein ACLTVV_07145 [Ruminococcus sp.]